jgi:hypothetical protein
MRAEPVLAVVARSHNPRLPHRRERNGATVSHGWGLGRLLHPGRRPCPQVPEGLKMGQEPS